MTTTSTSSNQSSSSSSSLPLSLSPEPLPFNEHAIQEDSQRHCREGGRDKNEDGEDDDDDDKEGVTYWSLIRDNVPYRLYLMSYIANYFGEWLTYLSSLAAVQLLLGNLHPDEDGNDGWGPQTIISYLVVVRLMTSVVLSPAGSVLADAPWDRRHVMIVLDLCGAAIAWLFVWAVQDLDESDHNHDDEDRDQTTESSATRGIVGIFVATSLQQAVSGGLYEPSRAALLPSLVGIQQQQRQQQQQQPDSHENKPDTSTRLTKYQQQALKKATIVAGMAWSTVAAVGSASGGFLVSQLGIRACFVVDCVTYGISALLMYWCARLDPMVVGYRPMINNETDNNDGDVLLCDLHTDKYDAAKEGPDIGTRPASSLEACDIASHPTSPKFGCCWLISMVGTSTTMAWDGLAYVCRSFWGPLVFLKCSALWLTLDVVNVKFAARPRSYVNEVDLRHWWMREMLGTNVTFSTTQNSTALIHAMGESEQQEEEEDAFRLGLLFAGVGIGCLLGPLIAERYTNMQRPETLQFACITAIGVSAMACLGMGGMSWFVPNENNSQETRNGTLSSFSSPLPWSVFGSLCVLTCLRAMGVSAVWINSSLLLQTYSSSALLGRVMSLDFALALMGESASAIVSGRLEDEYHWSPFQVCLGLGCVGLFLYAVWMTYYSYYYYYSDTATACGPEGSVTGSATVSWSEVQPMNPMVAKGST